MAHGGPERSQIQADAARMEAVAHGDEDVFRQVVVEEAPRLLRFANTVLDNPAEAEEVAQEALLRLWRQAPAWKPVARIGTWLHQVAYRLAVDLLRRRRPSVDADDLADVLVDTAPSPDLALALRRREEDMIEAIRALPERQRTAVVLAHFQGLSRAEAAAAMAITEEAYHSLLARGRRALKEALVAWTAEEPARSAKGARRP